MLKGCGLTDPPGALISQTAIARAVPVCACAVPVLCLCTTYADVACGFRRLRPTRLFAYCKADPKWTCIDCKPCENCKLSDNEKSLMFCDSCDRGVHAYGDFDIAVGILKRVSLVSASPHTANACWDAA